MSIIQVGLVDTTGKMNPKSVQAAASALNLQVMRDLPQFWNVQASVQYLPHASKIPADVWPVQLVKSLPPGEGGFHLDKHNQPYAKVIAAPNDDSWTIDASHETIEMLIDPSGNRMQSSVAIEIVGEEVRMALDNSIIWSKAAIPARRTISVIPYWGSSYQISSPPTIMIRSLRRARAIVSRAR